MTQRLILLFAFMLPIAAHAQTTVTLPEIVNEARSQSPQFKREAARRQVSYYQYLTFRSDLKPQIALYGRAPVFSKQYTSVVQPNGSITYLPIKQNFASAGFSLSQKIAATGGSISLNTDLTRFDDLQNKYHQYRSMPFFLQLDQPVFAFNSLKWQRKIEPLVLEESKKFYLLQLEDIATQVTNLYFNVLEAQENIRISEMNAANAKQNYSIEQKRITLGTTTEDKLLQLELQLLSGQQSIDRAKYDHQIALLALKATLGRSDTTEIKLSIPDQLPQFEVSLEDAIARAYRNRPEFVTLQRRKLEARRDVEAARSQRQSVTVSATYGLNGANSQLKQAYTSPKDQQTIAVGFNIPLVDWGRRKINLAMARSNQQLVDYTNQIDENNYRQELITLVKNLALLRNNIVVNQVRDSVALRRYTIANKLYQIGKLTVTDLGIAQSEKDNSRREYLNMLRAFWNSYYLLRKLTLYDYVRKADL